MTALHASGDFTTRGKIDKGSERLREEYVDTIFRASDYRDQQTADSGLVSLGFPSAQNLLVDFAESTPAVRTRSRAVIAAPLADSRAVKTSSARNGVERQGEVGPFDAYSAMIDSMLKSRSARGGASEEQVA